MAALALTVVVALLGEPVATPRVMEALVGATAAIMAVSVVKYTLRFVAIARHGAGRARRRRHDARLAP